MEHEHPGAGLEIDLGVRVMREYIQAGRRSGKTTAMIAGLKDSARVIVPNQEQVKLIEQLCRERDLKHIQVVAVEPNPRRFMSSLERLHGDYRPTRFEHTWLESFYSRKMLEGCEDVSFFHAKLEGFPPRYL